MNNIFAIAKMTFSLDGIQYGRNVFISSAGAVMVFDSQDAPENMENFLSQDIRVTIAGKTYPGVFIKEFEGNFTYYSFRFRELSVAERASIEKVIQETGARMPPKRKYPRLNAQLENIDIAVPSYAIYNGIDAANSTFFGIVDFTIGGLLLETLKEDGPSLRVGDTINFEIFISTGTEQIPDACGEIVRITETLPKGDGGEVYMRFGIKLHKMSAKSEAIYRKLIREYCLAMKETA